MPTLSELQQKRMAQAAAIRALGAKHTEEKGWPTQEDADAFQRANTDYNATMALIKQANERSSVTSVLSGLDDDDNASRRSFNPATDGDPRPNKRSAGGDGAQLALTEEERGLAMSAWLRMGAGKPLSQKSLRAYKRCKLQAHQREIAFRTLSDGQTSRYRAIYNNFHQSRFMEQADQLQQRDLTTTTGSSGKNLIGETFLRSVEINMLAYGGVRSVAETMTTPTGESIHWPTANDVSNMGEQLDESTSFGNSVDPTFGRITWGAYKYSSKPIIVPYELLEDNFAALPTMLAGMLAERLARITNLRFTTGNGTTQPNGIVTASGLGNTAASATAIGYDDVLKLIHSIDQAYRTQCGFMMNDNVFLALRLIKDLEGRPMWQTGMNSGAPDRLFDYPVTNNQDMAGTIAASAKTMLFGQLRKYKIRRVNGMRLKRLDELYAQKDQIAFIAYIREDGDLLNAGTNPVKHLIQAAS